jgi:hypothetical protein
LLTPRTSAPRRARGAVDTGLDFTDFLAALAEEAYASVHSCFGFTGRQDRFFRLLVHIVIKSWKVYDLQDLLKLEIQPLA